MNARTHTHTRMHAYTDAQSDSPVYDVQELVQKAADKWDSQGSYRDDITCVLVVFDHTTKP